MAAPSGAMSDLGSSSSSSSDEEELARCREAAMPAWGLEQRSTGPGRPRADPAQNRLPPTQPSLRRKVDEHEQDGNELQTTPEFRAHIAKKLGALLDSSITISEVAKAPVKARLQQGPAEDDGFRLFFTSLPGDPEKKASPPHPRKRPPSSSSSSEESDLELQRCREAAVSASALLQESAIHGPGQVEEAAKKKKKKKRKLQKPAQAGGSTHIAATTSVPAAVDTQGKEAAELNGDQTSPRARKKKRKKKVKKASEEAVLSP